MNLTKKVAVYGSLRHKEYNFKRFAEAYPGEIKFIRETKVKGYDLHSLGPYPGIRPSNNKDKELVVDVIECSENCFKRINAMELGAGYSAKTINVDGDECTIYPYNYEVNKIVESGDWSKR